jgi:ligand-binding sensor domain-containing protein
MKLDRMLKMLVLAVCSLTLFAAAQADTPSSTKESAAQHAAASEPVTRDLMPKSGSVPRVIESFQVGNEVYVRSLAIDPGSNSLWVGSSTGLLEIDLTTNQMINTFTRDDGLANEYVFAIYVDSQGYKWFGTNAGGTSRYKDGKWDVYFPMHGLADYWIYAFVEQKNGPLWIGTWAGANSVDLATMEFKTYFSELINEWVYALDIDSQDRVWFGTEGGISMYDGDTWREWSHKDGLGAANMNQLPPSTNTGLGTRSRHDLSVLEQGKQTYNPSYVFSLIVDDRDDSVWAGTWGGGVGHYDGKAWTNYTSSDGLAGNIVYSIAQDRNGMLWFGTNNGLSRYDGTSWITYDTHTGLLDNNVYAIAPAPSGELWVGTKNGVSRIAAPQQTK